jgi:hypothetical protein
MELKDDKTILAAIEHLSKSAAHWLEIKKVLEEDIKANQQLIILIDKIVQENEYKIAKLN